MKGFSWDSVFLGFSLCLWHPLRSLHCIELGNSGQMMKMILLILPHLVLLLLLLLPPSPQKNIARIAKRCPENITSVVKCVDLLFPKELKK